MNLEAAVNKTQFFFKTSVDNRFITKDHEKEKVVPGTHLNECGTWMDVPRSQTV